MCEFITHSRAETVALGRRMAGVLQPGALIAYTGGLGAGKTAFTEGLAEGLGCTDPVSSPTFAIDLLALENPIRVDIQRVDENTRRITIEGVTL